jgi:hypothetical protein
MDDFTFYDELGVEPLGFVGQPSAEEVILAVHPSIHKSLSSVPVFDVVVPSNATYIHRCYSTEVSLQILIDEGSLDAIHKTHSSVPTLDLIFSVHDSIHKHHYLDKWNAKFSYNCARYLDTPQEFRLLETPGCDKYSDPSIIPGDSGGGEEGDEVTIGGNHNDLSGLQGGVFDEYYHLTLAERNKLASMKQGSVTYVDRFQPAANNAGDGWVNPDTQVLEMYYNTKFSDVSVSHSSEADEVDGGYF